MRQSCGCWTQSAEASHQCLASEAGGIKVDRLLKAEKLQIEADGVPDDPPAGPQVDAWKDGAKSPRLKGGSCSGLSREARVCRVCRGFEA